jgi:hypothetical protein
MTTTNNDPVVYAPAARARAALPKELKSTCSKIALERTRPLAWHTAATLRKEVAAMLVSGQPLGLVQAHLAALLAAAVKAQTKK